MTDLTPDTPLIRNPKLFAAEMDGDLVMMSIEQGEYYGVGGVGPRIWELLEQPITISRIVARISEEFEVGDAPFDVEVERFVRDLLELGLIRLADPSTPASTA